MMDWLVLLKIMLLLVVSAYLLGCRTKKKGIESLQDWLDIHYPKSFSVIETRTDDPIKQLSFKVKNSIVASEEDTLIQFRVHWDKRQKDLGVLKSEVDSSVVKAKKELLDTRSLLQILKANGLTNFSCGIYQGDIRILLFEDPLKKIREEHLKQLIGKLSDLPLALNYGLGIDFMEAKAYGAEFGEIIPLAHWFRSGTWQRQNSILQLLLPPEYVTDYDSLNTLWQFNTESDRLISWMDKSRPIAEKWAKTQIKNPFILSQESTEYEALDKGLGVRIRFPITYSTTSDAEHIAKEYVVGDYLFDEDRFSTLRILKEE